MIEPTAVEFLSAILIFSRNPERLAQFYRDALGVPVEVEQHGNGPVHYGCELGDVHFAIHPAGNELDEAAKEQRFRVAFTIFSTEDVLVRLGQYGVLPLYPPKRTGFAVFVAILDPDGNYVELTELNDAWFQYLKSRRTRGMDLITRWESFTVSRKAK